MMRAKPVLSRQAGFAIRVGSLGALVFLWWGAAQLSASAALLPGPGQVASVAWGAVLDGSLPADMGMTLMRVAAAFCLSMALGTLLGYVAGRSVRANAWIDPWLVIALNLPVLVVIVLAYIWIGLNEAAAIVAVAVAKMPTVVVTVREGARALDPAFDELAQVYAVGLWRRLRRVIVPQMAPYLAAAARSGLSVTWKIVLIVELLGRPNGVGFALNLFFQNFDVAGILAYGLSFSALMLALEFGLLQPLEQRASAWR
jgi:NitT/TauT family transport system permease protein